MLYMLYIKYYINKPTIYLHKINLLNGFDFGCIKQNLKI